VASLGTSHTAILEAAGIVGLIAEIRLQEKRMKRPPSLLPCKDFTGLMAFYRALLVTSAHPVRSS